MIPSVVKTKYYGKKNNSYLPVYAHTKNPLPNDKKGRKVLISDTKLSIDVIVPEDSKVPLRIINSGGNFIIQQSLNVTVPTFIRLLAFDFKKWSAGDDSREAVEGARLS